MRKYVSHSVISCADIEMYLKIFLLLFLVRVEGAIKIIKKSERESFRESVKILIKADKNFETNDIAVFYFNNNHSLKQSVIDIYSDVAQSIASKPSLHLSPPSPVFRDRGSRKAAFIIIISDFVDKVNTYINFY